uniref:Uncharacterized protein n=1 Tax=viral metagenome TaxID=1070528 RepID=A0A6C0DEA6_9ZZZZ
MTSSIKKDINIFIPANNTSFVTIVSVFVIVLIILFLKPELFFMAFKTLLGNVILLFFVLGVSYINLKYGIAFALFFIILSRVAWTSSSVVVEKEGQGVKEGFTANAAWPDDLVAKFQKFQKVLNPNVIYDMKVIQQQATPDEVEYLFQHNKWPWSKEVMDLYQQAVAENSFVKVDPGIAMIDAQQIYNEMAMKEILSFGTKEGTFLLNGVVIGHNKNMPSNVNDVVKCGTDPKTKASTVEKVVYNGYDSISGAMNKTVTNVEFADIPGLVNGFKFLNEPCNPCSPLDNPPNYSCPFSLNTGNGAEVSPIWKLLWYPGGDGSNKKTDPSTNSTSTSNSENFPTLKPIIQNMDKQNFPILTQLLNEVNKIDYSIVIKDKNNVNVNNSSVNTNTTTTTSVNTSSVDKPK